jgi:hypothetical protein
VENLFATEHRSIVQTTLLIPQLRGVVWARVVTSLEGFVAWASRDYMLWGDVGMFVSAL